MIPQAVEDAAREIARGWLRVFRNEHDAAAYDFETDEEWLMDEAREQAMGLWRLGWLDLAAIDRAREGQS